MVEANEFVMAKSSHVTACVTRKMIEEMRLCVMPQEFARVDLVVIFTARSNALLRDQISQVVLPVQLERPRNLRGFDRTILSNGTFGQRRCSCVTGGSFLNDDTKRVVRWLGTAAQIQVLNLIYQLEIVNALYRRFVSVCVRFHVQHNSGQLARMAFTPTTKSVSVIAMFRQLRRRVPLMREDTRMDANEANRSDVALWPVPRCRVLGNYWGTLRGDRQMA